MQGPEGLGNEKEGGAEGKEGLGKAGGEVLGEQGQEGLGNEKEGGAEGLGRGRGTREGPKGGRGRGDRGCDARPRPEGLRPMECTR